MAPGHGRTSATFVTLDGQHSFERFTCWAKAQLPPGLATLPGRVGGCSLKQHTGPEEGGHLCSTYNPLCEASLGRLEAAQLLVPISSAVAGSHGRWMGMHTQKMLGLLSSQHLRFDCRWEPVGSFSPRQPGG